MAIVAPILVGIGTFLAANAATILSIAAIGASVALQLLNRPKAQDTEGPRLSDTVITTSTYGNAIPIIHGGVRVGANMIWATDIQEVKIRKKTGGKGGGGSTQTTYRYFANFQLGIARSEAGVGCISQIYADKKLIYDTTTGSTAFIKYKDAAIRIHMGGATQEPDPLIEADKGVGAVPAHRDLINIVFENFPLEDFGNRVPQIESVVSTNIGATTVENGVSTIVSPENLATFPLTSSSRFCMRQNPATRQMYEVKNKSDGWVARFDLRENRYEAVISFDGNTAPPIPLSKPGLFVGLIDDGGALFSNSGLDPVGVYPHADGHVYVFGDSIFGSPDKWWLVNVNPFTLQGIQKKEIVNQSSVGVPNISGFDFPELAFKQRVSLSVTRSFISGIKNYLVLVFTSLFSPQPLKPMRIFVVDRDTFVPLESPVVGGSEQYTPMSSIVDREGIIYIGATDAFKVDAASGAGPNGEQGVLIRIQLDKIIVPSLIGGDPAITVDVKINVIDLSQLQINSPLMMAYDEGTHSIVIVSDVNSNNEFRWIRWDIETQTAIVTRVFNNLDSEDLRRRLNTEFAQETWGQIGSVNGFLYAARDGVVGSTPYDHWRIRVNDLQEELVATPTPLSSNTYAQENPIFDPSENQVIWFASGGATGVNQRLRYDRCSPSPVALSTVINSILMDSGELDAGDIDLTDSDLTPLLLRGYVRGSRFSVRRALEPLTIPFLFDIVETGSKLKVVVRGKSSIRTIPESDLLRAPGDDADAFSIDRSQEFEVPLAFDFRYLDPARDYQEGTASNRRHIDPSPTQQGRDKRTIELPLVLSADEAQQAVETSLYQAWIARTSYKYKLGPKHLDLDPSDIVTITRGGVNFNARMVKSEIAEGFATDIASQSEDSESYASTALGSAGVILPQQLNVPGATELFVLDIPLLRDPDDATQFATGVYVAFGAYTPFWRAAVADRSFDGGANWDTFSLSTDDVPWGFVRSEDPLNAVGIAAIPLDPDPNATASGTASRWPDAILRVDEINTITVGIVEGIADLESVTFDDLFTNASDGNTAILGNQESAEIIKYQTVVDNGDGTVTLSTLLRGLRGTEESAVAGHAVGTQVVFIGPGTVNREGIDLNRLNVTDFYRATSLGELVESAALKSLDLSGVDSKPYPVNDIVITPAFTGVARGGVTLTWDRRTRVGGQQDLNDGLGASTVPISESLEEYDVVLAPKTITDVEVVKTFIQDLASPVTPTVSFSLSEITTTITGAGYTDGDLLNITIYQKSGIVGRGLPRNVTI